MNRGVFGCAATAVLMFVSLGCEITAAAETTEQNERGFYVGVTASRVEHDVEGWPGIPVAIATLRPGGPIPPPVLDFFGPTPRPPGDDGPVAPPIFPPYAPIAIVPTKVEVDEVDAGFSATVGYRVNRYLAAEVSYADFGEYEVTQHYSFGITRYELGVRGPSVSVLGSLPLGERWKLFLRGGVLFSDQEASIKVTSDSPSSTPDRNFSDEVVIAGAGVQWSFTPRWTARLEYQRTDDMKYDNTGESSIDQASLSVLFEL